MATSTLAFVQGKTAAKTPADRLWVALNRRASVDPDRPALLSPRQSASLLSGLVRPWPDAKTHDGGSWRSNNSRNIISSDGIRRIIRMVASPACILSYVLSWILETPDADAGDLRWSFAELERATMRLGSFLRHHGVKAGATVVFFTDVSAEWALLLAVSILNGYTAVTLSRSSLTSGTQVLQEQLDALNPSLIVVATQHEALRITDNFKTGAAVAICLERLRAPCPVGWTSMPEIAAVGVDDVDAMTFRPEDKEEDPDRAALVVYTSGSSGKPKGCPVSVRYLLSALGLLSKQLLPLLPAPISLISGVSSQSRCQALTLMSWATGNAAVMDAGESNAETILAALKKSRPVSLSLLVKSVSSIARAANYSADAIKSVKIVHLIGATVTMAILGAAQRTFPCARIMPTFAMTEATGIVSWEAWIRPPTIKKMPSWHGIAASGSVAPGAALKIVGPDNKIVRRGEVGELHLCSNSTINEYWGVNNKADTFYTGDDGYRWFVTGDDAVIDDQGLLYVLGRSAYTLRRDGEVVVPCTIENFLEIQFQGTMAAVVNITADGGDTGLYAVFEEAVAATSSADVQRLVAENLGQAFRIEGAATLDQVGFQEWPITTGGKIAYHELRPAIESYLKSILII